MRFDIITIFPSLFDSYLKESLIKKASSKELVEIRVHDLRKWAKDFHRTVDDKPFGGGSGMVMKVEPIYRAVLHLKEKFVQEKGCQENEEIAKTILFTPRGKKFNQQKANSFSSLQHIIMICGRYEGIDERVAKYIADEKISVGDYVLMGGELPAMVLVESISRLIPGVVGKDDFLKERMKKEGFLEYPQYTRPESFEIEGKERKVPPVLLQGNHEKIKEWKRKKGRTIS